MEIDLKINELIAEIRKKDLVLFGTGFVAEMFWQGLALHGLTERLRFCVITHAEPGQLFHGLPVYSLREAVIPAEAMICIAVHESVLKEIRKADPDLVEKGVWVNTFLIDLLYGEPVRTDKIPVSELMRHQDHSALWITVRYAAVREYLRRSADFPMAKDLYIRALSLHCRRETAVAREKQLEHLADSMQSVGFGEYYPPIRINGDGQIIDGLHRVACSLYLQIPAIPAAVYKYSDIYDKLLIGKNRLPESTLLQAGFTEAEMRYLRKIRAEFIAKGELD